MALDTCCRNHCFFYNLLRQGQGNSIGINGEGGI